MSLLTMMAGEVEDRLYLTCRQTTSFVSNPKTFEVTTRRIHRVNHAPATHRHFMTGVEVSLPLDGDGLTKFCNDVHDICHANRYLVVVPLSALEFAFPVEHRDMKSL